MVCGVGNEVASGDFWEAMIATERLRLANEHDVRWPL